tara:strand:+ start:1797 stop:2108 length:312 start_codon:yes stop_codon:yes gene_type:complete
MAARKRVSGGEKNNKSSTKWNEEELRAVFSLYLNLRDNSLSGQPKIHETVPEIIQLGQILGRTTRSVEAQMLMFRSLEKFGEYGRKNMNLICKKIWYEYLDTI